MAKVDFTEKELVDNAKELYNSIEEYAWKLIQARLRSMFYSKEKLYFVEYNSIYLILLIIMTEQKAQEMLSLDKLKDHCERQCLRHKDSKLGYEHYIFLRLLRGAYERDIEDYITDYYLIMKGELEL